MILRFEGLEEVVMASFRFERGMSTARRGMGGMGSFQYVWYFQAME